MRGVLGLVGAAAPFVAFAQGLPTSAQGEVSLTIYNNDLALVQDVRQLSLPIGRHRQEFPDVSAAIRPETVTLKTPAPRVNATDVPSSGSQFGESVWLQYHAVAVPLVFASP